MSGISILRTLLWPGVLFVRWAVAQYEEDRRARLRKRLDAQEPGTVFLYGDVRICCPENCHVGRGVAIHDANWSAQGGIYIGDHVHFGERVTILTVSHNYEGQAVPYDETVVLKPVTIEDNVWVGCDVVIAPGTHIEEGCVIAMGATVSGRIPRGSVVGAAKWRTLKTRDMDKYEALKADGKFL